MLRGWFCPAIRQSSGYFLSITRIRKSNIHSSSDKSPPILRFAPSPTGHLHLGGLRTALFNHLYAKSQGGKWILRIEDTDQKRLVPGAVEAMQDILKWTGLEYDEGPDKPGNCGPYIQSQRLDLYKTYADRLVESGRAYRDFRISSFEEENQSNAYVAPDEQTAKQLEKEGKPHVIRFKMEEKDVTFDDAVYGHLHFPYDRSFDDPILVKSNGWPTYHLANIVDDTEMGITHVFRGEEWLPSMPIHLNLYKALNLTPPKFVHLPLLVNPDGSKLSKRHADVHVESYRKASYEPTALLNFVALMGFNWHSPDSTNEVFTMKEMIQNFKLERISQSRACPDLSKLHYLNKHHFISKIEKADTKDRKEMISDLSNFIKAKESGSSVLHLLTEDRLNAIFEVIVKRSMNLSEAAEETVSLLSPVSFDDREVMQVWETLYPASTLQAAEMAKEHLSSLDQETFKALKDIELVLKPIAKQFDKQTAKQSDNIPKHGKGRSAFFKALRFAWTGKSAGPTLGEIMWVLGKEECIVRIEQALIWMEKGCFE